MNDNSISSSRLPVLTSFLPSSSPLTDKDFPKGLENRIKLLIQRSLYKKEELINRLGPISDSRRFTYHNFSRFVTAALKDMEWQEQNLEMFKLMIIRVLEIVKGGHASSFDSMALTSLYDQLVGNLRENVKYKELLEKEGPLLTVLFETGQECKFSYFRLGRISEYFKKIFDTQFKEREDLIHNIVKLKEECPELAFFLFESIKHNSLTLDNGKTIDEMIKDIYGLFFLIDKYQFDENVLSLLEMGIWSLWESKPEWRQDLAVNLCILSFKMHRLSNLFLKYFEEHQSDLLNEVFNCLIEQMILHPHAYEKFFISFVQNPKVYPLLTQVNCERLHQLSEQDLVNLLNLLPAGIQKLNLSHCEFEYLPKELTRFRELTNLNLDDCKELKNLEGIERLKNLERLNLEGCISLIDISSIQELPDLTYINMIKCPLEIETLSRIIKAEITLDYSESFETDRQILQLANQKKLNFQFKGLNPTRRNSHG